MRTGESEGATCTGHHYELRGHRCKSWFCAQCCTAMGLSVKEKLMPIIAGMQHVMMFTLTVDPKLFETPREAHEHVKKRRAISTLIERLHAKGHLKSRRYFAVREFQKSTEMEHYHVLVEASYVPFDALCEEWGRNRPRDAPPREGNEPEFGHVRFSAPKFKSRTHAAHYACKYLIKHPEHGYPDWVLKQPRMVRYTTSRGFWDGADKPVRCAKCGEEVDDLTSLETTGHDETCFCNACRGHSPRAVCKRCGKELDITREEAVDYRDCLYCPACGELEPFEPPPLPSTVSKRVSRCCSTGSIVKVETWERPGAEPLTVRVFVEPVAIGLPEAMERLGYPSDTRDCRLLAGDWALLRRLSARADGDDSRGRERRRSEPRSERRSAARAGPSE